MGQGYHYETMGNLVKKHIVISAVNIRKGGTLTVLKDCLGYLANCQDLKVTAIVHDRSLCWFKGIDYIEIPWSTKSWIHRLWCEYHTMKGISKKLQFVDLWFSLHDTTPDVVAGRQAVYCHTSFPFMKTKRQDWEMDYKIPLFARFTRLAYKINVRRNSYLVVQQRWLRESLSELIGYPAEKIIVAPPAFMVPDIPDTNVEHGLFFYPASADCHKNFETLCEAVALLEERIAPGSFRIVLTIDGSENRYAAWLKKTYGHLKSVEFHGFMSKDELYDYYGKATCLVFPSRIETWGLPISEFKPSGKPMILSDLPYAHETAAGALSVAFFQPDNASELANIMGSLITGPTGNNPFTKAPTTADPETPFADGWESLFRILLA